MSYLFIAHDLSVVRHLSDRIAVMYLGSVVEEGTEDAGLRLAVAPLHPGAALVGAAARAGAARQKDRILLQGDVPSPADPPSGCRFRTRCWKAQDICATEAPALVDRGQGHPAACHFAEAREVVPTRGLAPRRDRARVAGARIHPAVGPPRLPASERKGNVGRFLLRRLANYAVLSSWPRRWRTSSRPSR